MKKGDPLASTPSIDRFELLTQPAPQFKPFTFPRYQAFLDAPADAPDLAFAAGAWMGDMPVGLALVSAQAAQGRRQLLSIQSSAWLRRCGLATKLLATLEKIAVSRGTNTLHVQHSSRMAAAADFAAWLQRTGWSEPVEIEHRLAGHANWAEKAQIAWASFLTRLERHGFQASPWSNINDADRQAIRHIVAQQFTERERETAFDPFPHESSDALVLPISLVLRKHGEVVGWIFGSKQQLPGPLAFSYPRGYVIPSLRKAGWLIGGIHAVCIKQTQVFGGESLAIFEMAPSNADMRRFVLRQLKPYSVWTDIRYQSTKALSTAQETGAATVAAAVNAP